MPDNRTEDSQIFDKSEVGHSQENRRKQVNLKIGLPGNIQEFKFSLDTDEEETNLRNAAAHLNKIIKATRESSPNTEYLRICLKAALNISYESLEQKNKVSNLEKCLNSANEYIKSCVSDCEKL